MWRLTEAGRRILAAVAFFPMLYLTYFFTYLGPTRGLRRWGATTSWLLMQFGPAPAKTTRMAGYEMIGGRLTKVASHTIEPIEYYRAKKRPVIVADKETPAQREDQLDRAA